MQCTKTSLVAFLILVLTLLLLSPLFQGLLSLPSSVVYYPLVLILVVYFMNDIKIKYEIVLFFFVLQLLLVMLIVFTQSSEYVKRYLFQSVGILFCLLATRDYKVMAKYVDMASTFVWVCIALSVLGLIYAFLGGEPIFSIRNTDGRENFFYLSTFSNAVYGNVIRPSFIYDEPGALSFVICFIVGVRELYGRIKHNEKILFLGLVTLSLTHVIIFLLYLMINLKRRSSLFILFFSVLATMFVFTTPDFNFFASRFEVADGKLAGDTRSSQLENFERVINDEIFFFGNYRCVENIELCDHGDIGSSPVTPLYSGGILQLLIQLATHALLLVFAFRSRYHIFPAISMTVLILQRPFLSGLSYQLMIYITIFSLVAAPVLRRTN